MLGDRIALMEQGRIIETGPARDLFLAPEHEFTARFLGFGQVLDCAIGEEQGGAFLVHTPLGTLAIKGKPFIKENGGALFFVPRDGVRPARPQEAGTGKETGAKQFVPALFKRSIFEGDRIILTVELSGGLEFSVDAGPREPLPAAGERILLRIDGDLLKFLKPGTGLTGSGTGR
jgi:ABC-type sugar transport system ATPase subunit